jgi:RpiR family carbohydrate utilization transcriptional regulator
MTVLSRIKSCLKDLAPAQARVAQLLLADPRVFCALPVAELAQRAQVSNPTVVRFCRSVGMEGLSDFKLKMAAELSGGAVPFVHQNVTPADTTDELAHKVINNAMKAIAVYQRGLSTHGLDDCIEKLNHVIDQGGRIEFYGVGNSGIVAQDGQFKFFRLGCNTVAYADGHLQVMAATLLSKRDAVVVISNSGRSRDILDAVEIAKKHGALTIGITETGSPLAGLVKIHLAADHAERYEHYQPMISRLLHLLIIDIVATGVALKRSDELAPRWADIKRNLQKRRYRS